MSLLRFTDGPHAGIVLQPVAVDEVWPLEAARFEEELEALPDRLRLGVETFGEIVLMQNKYRKELRELDGEAKLHFLATDPRGRLLTMVNIWSAASVAGLGWSVADVARIPDAHISVEDQRPVKEPADHKQPEGKAPARSRRAATRTGRTTAAPSGQPSS